MKIFLFIFGGLIIAGAIVFVIKNAGGPTAQVAGYSADDPNAPKIEILEKRFDFGKISLKDIVKHEFKVKNIGKNPLVVKDLMTSCHCTTVQLKVASNNSPVFGMHSEGSWQGEIPKDSEAILEVIYEPAKHPAKGPISRVISFTTNDPSSNKVQLEIIADVE